MLQRPGAVAGGIVEPHSQLLLQQAGQLRRPLHEAGGAEADGAAVHRGRLQPKQVIEAGHPLHAAEGQPQPHGHLMQGRRTQPALQLLHLMQHLDQGIAAPPLLVDQPLDALAGAQGWGHHQRSTGVVPPA